MSDAKPLVVDGTVYVSVDTHDIDDGDSSIPFVEEDDIPAPRPVVRHRGTAGF